MNKIDPERVRAFRRRPACGPRSRCRWRSHAHAPKQPTFRKHNAALTLGALGVVFGDIGTSPLYAMRETALATGGSVPHPFAILGGLSLILWALIIVVTLKYVIADHARRQQWRRRRARARHAGASLAGLGRRIKTMIGFGAILGLALFFGDGMLTPAISVLSAVEGLSVESHALQPLVVPLALVILVSLFAMQSRGTAQIGRLFGPVMVVWFLVLAVLGVSSIVRAPQILAAVNPVVRRPAVRARTLDGFRLARLGRAGGHRLRGAVCRHGPFRPQADPARMVLLRAACAAAELFRPGRGAPAGARKSADRVLFRGAALGALSAGRCWRRLPASSRRRP